MPNSDAATWGLVAIFGTAVWAAALFGLLRLGSNPILFIVAFGGFIAMTVGVILGVLAVKSPLPGSNPKSEAQKMAQWRESRKR